MLKKKYSNTSHHTIQTRTKKNRPIITTTKRNDFYDLKNIFVRWREMIDDVGV